jgi:hypothetical protein
MQQFESVHMYVHMCTFVMVVAPRELKNQFTNVNSTSVQYPEEFET